MAYGPLPGEHPLPATQQDPERSPEEVARMEAAAGVFAATLPSKRPAPAPAAAAAAAAGTTAEHAENLARMARSVAEGAYMAAQRAAGLARTSRHLAQIAATDASAAAAASAAGPAPPEAAAGGGSKATAAAAGGGTGAADGGHVTCIYATFNRGVGGKGGGGGLGEWNDPRLERIRAALVAARARSSDPTGATIPLGITPRAVEKLLAAFVGAVPPPGGFHGQEEVLKALGAEYAGRTVEEMVATDDKARQKHLSNLVCGNRYLEKMPSWLKATGPPPPGLTTVAEFFAWYGRTLRETSSAAVAGNVTRYGVPPLILVFHEAALEWAYHLFAQRCLGGYDAAAALLHQVQDARARADPQKCLATDIGQLTGLGTNVVAIPETNAGAQGVFAEAFGPDWAYHQFPAPSADAGIASDTLGTCVFTRDVAAFEYSSKFTDALHALIRVASPPGEDDFPDRSRVWAARVTPKGSERPHIAVIAHGKSHGRTAAPILLACAMLETLTGTPVALNGDINARGTPDVAAAHARLVAAGALFACPTEPTTNKMRLLTAQKKKVLDRDANHKDVVGGFGVARMLWGVRLYAGRVLRAGEAPPTPSPGFGDHYIIAANLVFPR